MPLLLNILLFILLNVFSVTAYPRRVTFELPDGERRCFYQDLTPTKYVFMYQVIYGGQLDIDLLVEDPMGKSISQAERASHDEIFFNVAQNGSYKFCFDNTFSSVSHKLIYFELRPEAFESLADEAGQPSHVTALSLIESDVELVHLYLSRAETLQIELKNRELGDRMVAEDLNTAVLLWSCAVTVVILVTTLGQITVLKNFFNDKRIPSSHRVSPM
ncbi:hypothetical protein AHF37_03433 [Paragonimus kellicotti]|nr:hypothetical protein AHF37_03433 [Paragonimus kellicotti]